jgi:hypothetical protein
VAGSPLLRSCPTTCARKIDDRDQLVPANAWLDTDVSADIVEHSTYSVEHKTVLSLLWVPDAVAACLAIAEQHACWCVQFNGIQHKTCEAGIRYDTVRDVSQRPYRWPCFTDESAATSCLGRRMPTPEETELHVASVEAWLAELRDKQRRGECVHCGATIERAEQVEKCLYAVPCGCRIGHAQVDEYDRLLRVG